MAARGRCYARLAECLGIPVEECHIGMFTVERCQAALRILERAFLAADEMPL